jgi:hypothetical protein
MNGLDVALVLGAFVVGEKSIIALFGCPTMIDGAYAKGSRTCDNRPDAT